MKALILEQSIVHLKKLFWNICYQQSNNGFIYYLNSVVTSRYLLEKKAAITRLTFLGQQV